MTLRKKTLLVTAITLLGLVAVSYVISSSILLRGFDHLERQSVRRDLRRALAALNDKIAELDQTAADWAAWDDMYSFIADGNPRFIQTNLLDNVLLQMQLSVIAVVRSSGELVFLRALDLARAVEATPPDAFLRRLSADDPLLRQQDLAGGRAGIMVLPDGMLLVASRPVLTSEGRGPARGSLILARRFDAEQSEALRKQTHLRFSLVSLDSVQPPPADVALAKANLSTANPVFVQPLGADSIAAYRLLQDVDGNPSLVLRADAPRDIHRVGWNSLGYLMAWLLLAGLAFGGAMLLFLEKLVLSRLMRLSEEVSAIGSSGDVAGRVSVEDRDEVSRVAENVNRTLSILENYQQGLQEVLSRFETVIGRASFVAIQCFNRQGTILYWNDASVRLFGLETEEALARRIQEVIVDRDGAVRLEDSIGRALDKAETILPWEWEVPLPGDGRRTLLGSLFPIPDPDGVHEVFAMEVDITDRKRAEERVEAANRELARVNEQLQEAMERANQLALAAESASVAKSEFLARMSHEIRTPMNAVVGFTDMLFDTALTDEQIDYAHTIRRNCEALLALINDILDFSKIEARQITLESTEFDAEAIAYDVCATVHPRVRHQNVEVLCRIGDALPFSIKGDPARFRQIVLNLMENAAKFTQSGEIELTLDVDQRRDQRVRLQVMVRDTGIGIPEDKRDAIFELFQQVGGQAGHRVEGTGLGLAICRQLARLMDGDVWVEPGLIGGSVFHFEGWFEEAAAHGERRHARELLRGKKMLLVDDNQTNLEIVRHYLEAAGMRCLALTDGTAVVPAILRQVELNDPFDLAIVDLQMPAVDGCQVAENIHRLPAGVALPLIALSAAGGSEVTLSRQAGFAAYLQKPVRREKLLEVIERLLLGPDIGEGPPVEPPPLRDALPAEAGRSIRVLLAEDNPASRKLAEKILTKAGYRVDVANNGREAVEAYLATPDRFDLIFMDIQMPGTDGIQATREIRAAGFTAVPIVAMTANAMEGDRERCLCEGMNDYVAKPIRRELVYEMIKKWTPSKDH